jgi:hypothetical protein
MAGRRGISLVELMLTLSACTVILTMSAGLIHRAMHAHSKGRLFLDGERSALRLSDSFRRDTHAARVAATGPDAGDSDLLLQLELTGGQSVEYRQTAGRVQRLWKEDGKVRSRELFLFSPETRFIAEQQQPQLVVLSTVSPDDAADAASAPDSVGANTRELPSYTFPTILRAEAVLGRNRALVDTEPAEISKLPEVSP